MPRHIEPQRPPLRIDDFNKGKSACLRNITQLLRSARELIRIEPMHALVFYSIAVEEFGKMRWLGELESRANGIAPVDIPIGLFTDHTEKLRRGFSVLPRTCGNVMHGVRLKMNSISESKTIWYNPINSRGEYRARASVSIAGGATGQFMDASDAGGIAEITTRLEGLYVDWFYIGSGTEGQWSPSVAPDLLSLRSAIDDFEHFLISERHRKSTA